MLANLLAALEFSGIQLLYFGTVITIAAVIRGYAGFGFSAIVVSAMSLSILSKEAVPFVILLEIFASLQMASSIWKSINWQLAGCIILGALFLTPVGQMMLTYLPQERVQLIIACIILISVGLLFMGFTSPIPNKPLGWIIVGAVAGFFNGIAAMGGLAVMILLINTDLKTSVLRATIITLFFFTDCYATGLAIHNGIMDLTAVYRSLTALPFLYIGIKLGSYYFNPEHTDLYKRIAIVILFVLGLMLLFL